MGNRTSVDQSAKLTTLVATKAVVRYVERQARHGSMRYGKAVTEISIADNDNGRLDVAAFWYKTGQTWLEGFEVKTSRQDFLADVTARKYERYVPWVDAMWFACAEGVGKATELPAEIGFMTVRGDGTVRVVRRPKPTHKRHYGRQMDRIAVRLADMAGPAIENREELERTRRIMQRAAELPGTHQAARSEWWGKWLNTAVRERIRVVAAYENQAADAVELARRDARYIIKDAELKAARIAEHDRRWATALPLHNALAVLLAGQTFGLERDMRAAAEAIQQFLDDHGDNASDA